ncbi:TerC/Alx family metal homeostasis membrane protein [Arcanobacterium wilhelmae]|nr:TerC/Alx family metal homeostasis membrane protein [Arcanobacterium wilhelmae]WFN91142.1 TerC/Alx family metal homeostasis membrane protein [Arcanobacterium wilhelmae]
MHVDMWEWIVLGAVVIALILFDLLGHVRKAHEPTVGEAARWTALYVSLAVVFGVMTIVRHGGQFGAEFFAGYLTEYSLSLDNIFVFIIIIAAFRVPRLYQQKVLMYGIVIALVLRFVFILLGAAIIERFVWAFFFFGAWMLWTAFNQIKDGIEEGRERLAGELEEEEFTPPLMSRMMSKWFNVTEGFVGAKLVTRRHGKTWITPLLLCIVSIGTIDLLFALDSIPAIYGLTAEPFIVFAANAFALLGLRQLFFLVDGLLERLIYLHYGLAVILGYIGYKLIVHAAHGYEMASFLPEPGIIFSVAFIIVTILVTVIASIIGARRLEARGIVLNKDADEIDDIEPREAPHYDLENKRN